MDARPSAGPLARSKKPRRQRGVRALDAWYDHDLNEEIYIAYERPRAFRDQVRTVASDPCHVWAGAVGTALFILFMNTDCADCARPDLDEFIASFIETANSSLIDGEPHRLADAFFEVSTESDALLLVAIAHQESRFDARAQGPSGALGLMQLQPATAVAVSAANAYSWSDSHILFEPGFSIRVAAAYLRDLENEFEDLKTVLVAYNQGPTKTRRSVRKGNKPSTRYSRDVLASYHSLRSNFATCSPGE